jgi:predicted membrane GTPase involved in stress response
VALLVALTRPSLPKSSAMSCDVGLSVCNTVPTLLECCGMDTAQLEFPSVKTPTPEEQVIAVLRRARDRYGRNLKPFFDELLAHQPQPKTNEYAELVAVAKQRRQQT